MMKQMARRIARRDDRPRTPTATRRLNRHARLSMTSRTVVRRALLAAPTALAVILLGSIGPAARASRRANYDEAKVGQYTPPDPLITADGRKVTTPDLWNQERRPELLRLFETEVYGKVPQPPEPIRPMFRLRSEDTQRPGRDRHPPRGHDRVLGEAGRPADGPPDLPAEGRRPVAACPGVPGAELRRQPHDPPRPGDHAVPAVDATGRPDAPRRTTRPPSRRGARRRRDGRSSGSSPAAMPWRRSTTATSTPTSTTGSRTASIRSSTGPARRGPRPTSGARSPPGPGA